MDVIQFRSLEMISVMIDDLARLYPELFVNLGGRHFALKEISWWEPLVYDATNQQWYFNGKRESLEDIIKLCSRDTLHVILFNLEILRKL